MSSSSVGVGMMHMCAAAHELDAVAIGNVDVASLCADSQRQTRLFTRVDCGEGRQG